MCAQCNTGAANGHVIGELLKSTGQDLGGLNHSYEWLVRLFGTVSVESANVSVDHFPTRRATLILIRLALAQGRAVSRDAICSDLWPDDYLHVTRTRLRQELKRLNEALGRENKLVISEHLALRLDPSRVGVDVRIAEQILVRAAVAPTPIARVNILEELLAFGDEIAPGYDDFWIEAVREDWRTRVSWRFIEAANICAEVGDANRAIIFAKKAASVNIFSEAVQGELLKLLVKLDRRKEAISHLSELDRSYRKTLGTGPTDRLLRILDSSRPVAVESSDIATNSAVGRPLPAALSSLVGRQAEIEEIARFLSPSGAGRFTTLTGPGGIGKTELALETGRRLFEPFEGRVWFVPLAGIDNPRLIGAAIQDALGIAAHGGEFFEFLSAALGDRPALLILDNLEQFADGGAHYVRRLLERCGSLKLLLTSRRKLKLEGEQVFNVPALTAEAAAELFCQVAQRARFTVSQSPEELDRVLGIVNLLDRMPLAIHLAASRAGMLSSTEMLAQLSKRFEFLVSRRADIEPRHRSLLSTIEWNYDHLSRKAQQVLLDLSVFRDGWTLQLAQQVSKEPGLLGALEELCENSLVQSVPTEPEMRFNMLISIREFAENLQDPARANMLLRRMSDALLELSQTAAKHSLSEDQFYWMDRLGREHGNIHHALQFASTEDRELGIKLCANLWRFWSIKGHHLGATEWFDLFLAQDAAPTSDFAYALFGAARCATERGDLPSAEGFYLRCMEVARTAGLGHWSTTVPSNLALVYICRGQFEEAERILRAVVAEIVPMNNAYLEAISRDTLAIALIYLDQLEEARFQVEKAIELLSEQPDPIATAWAEVTMGRVLTKTGQTEEARKRLKAGGDILANHGHRQGAGSAQQYLAELCLREGDLQGMERHCELGDAEYRVVGDRLGLAHVSLLRGEAAKRRGAFSESERFHRDARSHLQACGAEAVLDLNLYCE